MESVVHPLQTLKLTVYYRRVLENAFQAILLISSKALPVSGSTGCQGIS